MSILTKQEEQEANFSPYEAQSPVTSGKVFSNNTVKY